jgi:hypothetical protein
MERVSAIVPAGVIPLSIGGASGGGLADFLMPLN